MDINDRIIQNPNFVYLKNADICLNNKCNIYFFHYHFRSDFAKTQPKNSYYNQCSQRIYDFKNGQKYMYAYYRTCMQKINTLPGNWVMCSIPGHDQVYSNNNPMNNFLRVSEMPHRFKLEPGLIKRTARSEKKHGSNSVVRNPEKDLKTMALANVYIKDMNVIVFDDVTTSGSALSAAKYLLYNAGAANVVCVAFAKTFEKPFYY